jgi:magnesium-transporting ATPase (P-type)
MWLFVNKHLFWATGLSLGLFMMIMFIPSLADAFHLVPMDKWYYWLAIFLGCFSIFPGEEFRKYLIRRKYDKFGFDYINKENIKR